MPEIVSVGSSRADFLTEFLEISLHIYCNSANTKEQISWTNNNTTMLVLSEDIFEKPLGASPPLEKKKV